MELWRSCALPKRTVFDDKVESVSVGLGELSGLLENRSHEIRR